MKDVRVPAQLMRAMAAEAEAAREARAKVIIIIHMLLLAAVLLLMMMMMRLMMLMTWAIHHHHHQVIAAEGEHKASRALKHAADVIADSPAALQVN